MLATGCRDCKNATLGLGLPVTTHLRVTGWPLEVVTVLRQCSMLGFSVEGQGSGLVSGLNGRVCACHYGLGGEGGWILARELQHVCVLH